MNAELVILKERLDGYRYIASELLRILFGLFLVGKGYSYIENPSELSYFVATFTNVGSSALLMQYIVATHVVGGLLIALGFYTRTALLLHLPAVLGAIFLVHAPAGFFNGAMHLELAILTTLLLAYFLYSGSGRWSLDYLMYQKS
jgi:putative oxidoreductase